MDYKEKYEHGLECIQEILSGAGDLIRITTLRKRLQPFFPELKEKESEDEQMIKRLKSCVYASDLTPEGREEILTWLEKQGENKPTYKVEPKFHEGDWITNGDYTWEVTDIADLDYVLRSQDGNIVDDTISYVDEHFHLWTIHDAKDGDVLCCESGWTCIFKALNSDISFSSYCFIDATGWFCETGSESHTLEKAFIKAYNGNIYPATKEQRDLLFQKMKEAGYEWDTDKKELKKIEPKKVNANKVVIEWINANKVIEWLKNTIRQKAENYGVYKETRLVLPYNSIEDLINDFKENFGL